jgi:hypothetical protein
MVYVVGKEGGPPMRLFRALFPAAPDRKRLYLDMDGVLLVMLGREVVPARYAEEFADFTLANFDVYWLITHNQGDAQAVLDRLDSHTPPSLRRKLARVQAARFHIEKTEALTGDFYWLGAKPLQIERNRLRQRNQADRWLEVNTYVRPDDLLRALAHLRSVLVPGGLPLDRTKADALFLEPVVAVTPSADAPRQGECGVTGQPARR